MTIERKNLIVSRCDKTMVFAFCWLIYFLPISISLIEWGFGIAFIAYIIKRLTMFRFELTQTQIQSWRDQILFFLKSFKPVSSPLNFPIGLFTLASLMSVIFSQCFPLSIKGFVFKLLENIFFCFLMIECMNSRKRIQIFITVFLISIAVISIDGIYQYLNGIDFLRQHLLERNRVEASFRHPNDFGAYLIIVISFLFNYSFASRKSLTDHKGSQWFFNRIMVCVLFVLATVCMGLTLSRGAWIGFFVGLIFTAFSGRRQFVVVLVVIGSFILIFNPMLKHLRNVSFISDDIGNDRQYYKQFLDKQSQTANEMTVESNASSVGDGNMALHKNVDGGLMKKIGKKLLDMTVPLTVHDFNIANIFTGRLSGMGRLAWWSEIIDVIKAHPLFGTGLNTYTKIEEKTGYPYPHNCYLQMAFEIGIVGLLAFLFIIWCIFYNGFLSFKKITDPYYKHLLMGLLAGLLGFLVHSAFDTNFYSVQLSALMWIWMGFIIAVQKLGVASSGKAKDESILAKQS